MSQYHLRQSPSIAKDVPRKRLRRDVHMSRDRALALVALNLKLRFK